MRVAIISSASFVRELLAESPKTQRCAHGLDAKFIFATSARTTPIIEISPRHNNPPLETPEMIPQFRRKVTRDWPMKSQ